MRPGPYKWPNMNGVDLLGVISPCLYCSYFAHLWKFITGSQTPTLYIFYEIYEMYWNPDTPWAWCMYLHSSNFSSIFVQSLNQAVTLRVCACIFGHCFLWQIDSSSCDLCLRFWREIMNGCGETYEKHVVGWWGYVVYMLMLQKSGALKTSWLWRTCLIRNVL